MIIVPLTVDQCAVWLAKNWVELVGVIVALVMLPLFVANKWMGWVLSIISSFFYIYINFISNLYACAGFCFCNIVISFYGLYCWRFTKSKKNLSFCFVTKKLALKLMLIGIVVWVAIKFFLVVFTDVHNPLDALITTLNLIAAWMTAKKVIESWFLWLISDVLLFISFLFKEMYPSAFLYVVFIISAIFGYTFWRKQVIKNYDNSSFSKKQMDSAC